MNNWEQIAEEFVLTQPYQCDVEIPKDWVVHPQDAGIPFVYNGHRFDIHDKAIHIKGEDENYYLVHWEWYNPATHLIDHGLVDAKGETIVITALAGALARALSSSKVDKSEVVIEGALEGLVFGGLLILVREISDNN